MMRIMLGVGLLGALLLVVFTLWLAARNWSPDVQKPVATVIVGGVVVLLVTLLTILRPTEIKREFTSSVVIDNRIRRPAKIGVIGLPAPDVDASLENRLTARHSAIDWLGRREPVVIDEAERLDAVAAEFFEYKLILDLVESIGSDSRGHVLGPDAEGTNRFSVSVRKRKTPPIAATVNGETILSWLAPNRLSTLPVEQEQWRRSGAMLPAGARVRLTQNVVNTVPERRLDLEIADVATVSIVVRGLGSPGAGILPPAVRVDLTEVPHLSTYGIDVSLNARFNWSSAASPQMPALKEWVAFVFGRLEQLNSDSPSSDPIVVGPIATR